MAVTFEPLLGSLIGWVFFDTPSPQIWTLLGGPLLITGMILVIWEETNIKVQEGASMSMPKQWILMTNDDGVESESLLGLGKALADQDLGVVIFAPLTTNQPLE